MDAWRAFAVDPLPLGIDQRPAPVVLERAGGKGARLVDCHAVQRLHGVDHNPCQSCHYASSSASAADSSSWRRHSSQPVGATTRTVPRMVRGPNDFPHKRASKAMPKPTCVSPATETRAGGPEVKAFVRKNWPTVAESPTHKSIVSVRRFQSV